MSMPPYPDLTGKTVPRKIEELENAYIKLSRFVDDALKTVDARNFTQSFYRTWNDSQGNITSIQGSVDGLEVNVLSLQGDMSSAQSDIVDAQAAADTANENALSAAGIAESKGKVIIQSSAPAEADRLAQNLWIDTTDGENTPKKWSGSEWVSVTDKAATDAADAAVAAQETANSVQSAFTTFETDFNVWSGGVDIDISKLSTATPRNLIPHRTSFWEQGYFSPTTGEGVDSTYYIRTVDFIAVESVAHQLTFYNSTTYRIKIYCYDASGTFLDYSTYLSDSSITFAAGTAKIKVVVYFSTSVAITADEMAKVRIILETGSASTGWTPAVGDTDDTIFGSAYYRFKSDGLHIYSGGLNIWDGTPDAPGDSIFQVDSSGKLIIQKSSISITATNLLLESYSRLMIDSESGVGFTEDTRDVRFMDGGTIYAQEGSLGLNAATDINLTAGGHINIGTVLYNNVSGTASTITLSSSAANFNYLEIFYRDNVSVYSFVKVAAPNGKYVSLGLAEIRDNDEKYEKNARIYISGTSVTFAFNNESHTTASLFDSYAMSAISITKIIGH